MLTFQGSTALFLDYMEYVAATQRNGVFPPYSYYMYVLMRTQF